jgi:hypothetical protein
MKISPVYRAIAWGSIAIFAATSLAACAPGGSSSGSTEGSSREASAYRASRLCVLNDTDKTIMSVGEFDMKRTGESHPDPTGPLKPGATWCTNGYNSFTSTSSDVYIDATVEIKFTETGDDFTRFTVANWSIASPIMFYGQQKLDGTFEPGTDPWEVDVTYPAPDDSLSQTVPSHDFHLRRLDDTTNFKEWLVTVRR